MQEHHEFKFGTSLFDFEQMIVITGNNVFWKLKYEYNDNRIYRMGAAGWHPQAKAVNEAYLNYVTEKILLGDD